MPLTTGTTWHGNTAFGPSGGKATGYATKDSKGDYSNFRDTSGRSMGGYDGSNGRITSTSKGIAPSQQPAKFGSNTPRPNTPTNKVVKNPQSSMTLDQPAALTRSMYQTKLNNPYRGPKFSGMPGGFGVQAYEAKHRMAKAYTDRVPQNQPTSIQGGRGTFGYEGTRK